MIIVSTDGSCPTDGDAIGWAWVAHGSGRFDSGGAADGTAQVAELTALRHAVEAHPGDEPLFVESGSQWAIRCASEWLEGWKAHAWRTASGEEVPHRDAVQALDEAISARPGPVRFRWVRGHVDSPFTTRARELAELAAQDWAAGRGELDGLLLDDSAARETSHGPVDGPEPEPVGARRASSTPTSGPGWELGTLFD
ncbi:MULTISPECIES: RNase H family protein [Isoptericola]|uniref:ribonuclease H n=1 Tax=Isoptericola haloaureus TaxID=1542902 RepID=A0ABU7ZAD6_9MICO|nr:RNase H family protein [Isoptericola sp. AK164]